MYEFIKIAFCIPLILNSLLFILAVFKSGAMNPLFFICLLFSESDCISFECRLVALCFHNTVPQNILKKRRVFKYENCVNNIERLLSFVILVIHTYSGD